MNRTWDALDWGSVRIAETGRMLRIVHAAYPIIDAEGDRVVSAPAATWDRNLWQILFDRPRFGTLDLGKAVLDIEAFAGRIEGADHRPSPQIVAATLGDRAGMVGAAALARAAR